MKKIWRRVLSLALVVSLLLTSNISALAAAKELYLSDLRLVYADDYKAAKKILSDSEFEEYELLNENLNEDTGNTGVWLAYKTTTDIEDAITDIATIQMCGGYQEGNYQEMIKESYEKYMEMGESYQEAIEYFVTAYDEGHFPAEAAYRQLNFYTVESDEDVPDEKKHPFEGELLGDIFYDGIDTEDLATLFFEGNLYVLQNIRSLLAMGVSYNEDGKTYLEKVGDEAAAMTEDAEVYDDEDYEDIVPLITPAITVIQDKLHQIKSIESDLDYTDEDFTDEELEFAESKAIADMLRDVDYLDGKTLYQFVLDYDEDSVSEEDMYPLVAALNEGQLAMTKVAHYYDVVRYSLPFYPEEQMTEELDKMEEVYGEDPFNVYAGVDRTVYTGTFALTSEAYRADVYGEGGVGDALFGGDRWKFTAINLSVGALGAGIFVGGIVKRGAENAAAAPTATAVVAAQKATTALKEALDDVATTSIHRFGREVTVNVGGGYQVTAKTFGDALDQLLAQHNIATGSAVSKATMFEKYQMLMTSGNDQALSSAFVKDLNDKIQFYTDDQFTTWQAYQETVKAGTANHLASTLMMVAGGIMLLYSAVSLGLTVLNYYNPDYEDIPVALVDLVETTDGDRYIKYDAVLEAEEREKGYYPADLNAFEGQRWNALYYTKSYEAGKPLLADEFIVSISNNMPKDGYTPVHRFGEQVCYDLNKYNFSNKSPSIYLSVKQSKNDKSAVADVPEVVGSIFGGGLWMLFGGAGALVGVGGTLITQSLLKKKKTKSDATEEA